MRLLLALALAATFAAPLRAEWLVAETKHFRLHEDASENRVREHAAMLEDYRSLLVALTNAGRANRAPEPRLNVYILKDIADAMPFGKLAPNVAGFYHAGPGGVAAFAEKGALGTATVLHEYAHHFMLASGAYSYPSWYIEGFAEYFMTATFRPKKVQFGKFNDIRYEWLQRGFWLPLEDVLARNIRPRTSSDTAMFYAQSWLLTHYLFRSKGHAGKLPAYLAAVGQGADPVEAFKTHIDPDLRAFQTKLKGYGSSRKMTYSTGKRPAITPASVKISALSAAADDLLMPLVSLELVTIEDNIGEREQEIVTKAVAKHPESPMAARALALLDLRLGNQAAAAARFDALLKASPNDPSLLRWRAESVPTDTAEGRSEARQLLVRSYQANPDDWRTMRDYALIQGARTQTLNENDLEVLGQAWQLAPQVSELAIDLAVAYAHADKLPLSARVLAPLAADPHGSWLKDLAIRLRDAAAANNKPAFFAAFNAPEPEEVAAAEPPRPTP